VITVGTNYTIIWVLGAVTLNADGSLSGNVSEGYINGGGVFNPVNTKSFTISAPDLQTIMSATPDASKSRRDDLTHAVLGYLIGQGVIVGNLDP
jgi:hypothetical protein